MNPENTHVICDNCGWTGQAKECGTLTHPLLRVAPGEVMPYGECPKCEAVCHAFRPAAPCLEKITLAPVESLNCNVPQWFDLRVGSILTIARFRCWSEDIGTPQQWSITEPGPDMYPVTDRQFSTAEAAAQWFLDNHVRAGK